jgi:hypothetical protein
VQNSKLVMELQSYGFSDVLLLTATPLQNSIEELWSLLNLLDPQKFQYRSLHGHAMSCLNDDHLTLMLLDWLRVSCRVVSSRCVSYLPLRVPLDLWRTSGMTSMTWDRWSKCKRCTACSGLFW